MFIRLMLNDFQHRSICSWAKVRIDFTANAADVNFDAITLRFQTR